MPVVQLTQALTQSLPKCPEDKSHIELCDTAVKGLYVEVRATSPGIGTYYLRYKDAAGKTCHQKLGSTTEVKLTDAKERALQLKAEISNGKDPKEETLKKKSIPTFAEFFEDKYLPFVKQHKRTWSNDEQMYNTHLKREFGHLKLSAIKREAVQKFHSGLKQQDLTGSTCDHYLKLMRHALNLAVDWDIIESNQLARVKLFRECNQIERYMNDVELARLLKVLHTDDNRSVSNLALFLLATGARSNEARQAKWDDIDVVNRLWKIPAINSKSKKIRNVPLNDAALEVLATVNTLDEFEYVFVNLISGKPYACVKKTWHRLRATAGLPKLRLHDLRHQYASMLVNAGRSLYEVQQLLGHSDPKVTTRYAHLAPSTLQQAANSVSPRLGQPSGF
ncbi:site-specific integrase [Paraglaciecola hydrolytica]|uniref:Integrase n=1 Tax=Paraglaciecola hydrolytica TaxID=1799789 RepID=A0A148KLQ4_9ALTE|nr:site-specific integrase [Paraglaciecola hydrolytica]KXI27210.1 integrase [Paraglaciecola hydrolytica]